MKNTAASPQNKRSWPIALPLLVIILAVLFRRSFLPDYVHFSNDNPLGIQKVAWQQLPQGLTGMWSDLNDIGAYCAAFPPDLTALIRWTLGAVGYAKFAPAIAIFILGAGAWFFFRQLRLSPLAATLGALATVLNSTFFSDACWGVPSHQIAFGMDFLALALIVSRLPAEPAYRHWVRLALAGLAVGVNVMEAFDIGAIFSLFIAAFTLFYSFMGDGSMVKRLGRSVGWIVIVAAFATFIATQSIVGLVSTSIQGIAGTGQSEAAKVAQWDFATEWSLPKIEALGIAVPGLFGYRMDTPNGGNYWGAVGRDPRWDRYFAGGEQGSPPAGLFRFTGTGNYAGILVILITLWTIAQSLRRQNSVFSENHRRFLWFWTVVLIVSLLLAFGRFAPFYALFYKLPYLSNIRNPIKFLFVFSWALTTIFAYGIHGLSRRYLEIPAVGSTSPLAQLKTWWTKVRNFDRNYVSICVVAILGSLPAWLVYWLQKPALARYLQTVQFDEHTAGQIATFSISQVGWYILFLVLAVGLLALVLSGAFAGPRAKWGGICLGVLLILDSGRADLPWIVYWNYPQKYASNPIIDILRDQPYEHRVAVLHSDSLFENLYNIEWAQQLFTYYNIQTLDITQAPRRPTDLEAYEAVLSFDLARHWELTNTRYLVGPAAYLDALNQQLDPEKHRFHIVQRFNIVPKLGVDVQKLNEQLQHGEFHGEKLTAALNDNGSYALFEFTGALPRVKLYSDWQVCTGEPAELQQWVKTLRQRLPQEMGDAIASLSETDLATLQTLVSANFNAWRTVLISTNLPTPPAASAADTNSGTIEFKSYATKDIVFSAHAEASSVLLFNDKYDPNWHVFVDGKPALLLRCNFIMRGVYLTPGTHTVEFKFVPPIGPLYVSLSAIGVGILLCGILIFSTRQRPTDQNPPRPS
jgi:hypothetical protein